MELGVEKGKVLLVPHHEGWAKKFQLEKERLQQVFLEIPANHIQHIGSTSVPGLIAKPILDIALQIEDIEDLPEIASLHALNYQEKVGRLEGRQRVFVKSKDNIVTHHLHIIEKDNPKWETKLHFRNLLIGEPNFRMRYEALKWELFHAFKNERRKYTDSKANFIRSIGDMKIGEIVIPKQLELKSQRFCLRIPNEADIPFVFSATRVKGFNDGMLWDPPERIEELSASLLRSQKAWEEGRGYAFSIDDKISNTFLGRISIRETKLENVWNIGFWTLPQHQKKGVMKEAVSRILQFGFEELRAIRIEAEYAIWNIASEKVLQANNFKFVLHIKNAFQKNGNWVDENRMGINLSDWLKA